MILDELVLALGIDDKSFQTGEQAVVAGLDRLTAVMENVAQAFDTGEKKNSGLIGYPIFTNVGLSITTLFSADIFIGRKLSLETSLPNASGQYAVIGAVHTLTSWVEGGQWSTTCDLLRQPGG